MNAVALLESANHQLLKRQQKRVREALLKQQNERCVHKVKSILEMILKLF